MKGTPATPPQRPWRLLLGVFLLSALAMAFFRLPYWVVDNFGDVSLEQVLFHATLDDVSAVPAGLLRSSAREFVLKPLLWALLMTAVCALVQRWRPGRRHALGLALLAALGLVVPAVKNTAQALNLSDHLQPPADGMDWMREHYVRPPLPALAAQLAAKGGAKGAAQPRNLVLIYVESLQRSRIRPGSLLDRWQREQLSAERFITLPGTQWTLGGMVASQCALPLMPLGLAGKNNFDGMTRPLAEAVCLGDLLKAAGYQTAFVGGADPAFSGKAGFLRAHGFDAVLGRDDIVATTPSQRWPDGWWGTEDHHTLRFAESVVDRLAADPRPFFLNLLTLDTHGPNGLPPAPCPSTLGPNPAPNRRDTLDAIFDCSLAAVERFLAHLQGRGLLEHTVVVVMGDHPLMAPGWRRQHGQTPADARDDVFFVLHAPGQTARRLDMMGHFDVLPLTVNALLARPGDAGPATQALGLGRAAPHSPSLVQVFGPQAWASRLRAPSATYAEIWRDPPGGARTAP